VSVQQAQQALDNLLNPDAVAIAQQELVVAQAERQLERVQASYEDALTAAELALEQARLQHELKIAPASEQEIAAAESTVESAQVQLERAQTDLNYATLRAPFAGLVASLSASIGEQVGSGAILELFDPTKIRIEALVDETDVASVRAGQEATVTFEGLQDQRVPGRVLVIAPTGTINQGVVSYQAIIEVDRTEAGGVRPGMTATASIVTESRENVIVVPNRAIRRQGQQRTVQVMTASGDTETRRVEVGLANDQSSEIISGLEVGDTVVISATTTGQARIPGLTGGGGGRRPF
jgi:RND family efflux transporter MFP subunit